MNPPIKLGESDFRFVQEWIPAMAGLSSRHAILGLLGEYAFAKWLGVPWLPYLQFDVAYCEVKTVAFRRPARLQVPLTQIQTPLAVLMRLRSIQVLPQGYVYYEFVGWAHGAMLRAAPARALPSGTPAAVLEEKDLLTTEHEDWGFARDLIRRKTWGLLSRAVETGGQAYLHFLIAPDEASKRRMLSLRAGQ